MAKPEKKLQGITWLPVAGFTGYYVSNRGEILSKKRKTPKLMALCNDQDGYKLVNLTKKR